MAIPEIVPVAEAPGVPPDSEHGPDPLPTAEGYRSVRAFSGALAAPLCPEDCVAQSMPDTSPVKWHLAHTTWFFETFVLMPNAPGYEAFHPDFTYLFNSYYNGVGDRHARPHRGLLTRPTLEEVLAYRRAVDEHVSKLLEQTSEPELLRIVEIGLHHEQQHQELILTDLKHLFAQNAMGPAYRAPLEVRDETVSSLGWVPLPSGVQAIGIDGDDGFSFDNERPRHRVFLEPAAIADRLVTNGEYRAFIEDGGYERPELWLDVGWATVQREGWQRPLYWRQGQDGYTEFTLAGERPLVDAEPVSHVSFIEANAFARWAGARLPTEAEWEVACADREVLGTFVESGRFHPAPAKSSEASIGQLYGDVWEWTQSSYGPYPGYRAEAGTLGEYNGKFMCDQIVLRGGSCASSRSHLRSSYRNFFYAPDRWQFTGIRLAKDAQ